MYRSVIKERARLLRRAIAWLELRGACPPFSSVWSIAQIGFIYTLWRLETGDVPPQAARRDTDDFLSPQDRINSLRFSQTQVRGQDDEADDLSPNNDDDDDSMCDMKDRREIRKK